MFRNRHNVNHTIICGVYQPLWHNWGLAEPSLFLTPDALHQWHKFFYDHILKWVINIMGGPKLDYCLMALQPHVCSHQWPQGVSTLKQCTGQDHQALETLIVAVAAGTTPTKSYVPSNHLSNSFSKLIISITTRKHFMPFRKPFTNFISTNNLSLMLVAGKEKTAF